MIRNTLFILTVAALVGACASAKVEPDPTAHIDFHPVYADTTYKAAASGAVFNPAGSFDLFMDLRARAVGDILTIALVEKTNAQKEQSTSTAKKSKTDTGTPIIAGGPITYNGKQILSNSITGDRAFDGKAEFEPEQQPHRQHHGERRGASAERQPAHARREADQHQPGRGIHPTAGHHPSGRHRPDNAVASTKVADAKISYSARGALADSNKQGWLSRFFNSPIFPF